MISELYRRYRFGLSYARRLRLRAWNVHPDAFIGPRVKLAKPVVANAHSFFGAECRIGPNTEIGRYTMLAARVSVVGADHVFDDAMTPMVFAGRPPLPKTQIGEDCWLGYGVVVMAGVTIGDGAIVAASSVVTTDLAPRNIYGGVPAKLIRPRFAEPDDVEAHIEMLKRPTIAGAFERRHQTVLGDRDD